MPPTLWLGFFENFKSSDTVLVSGSANGMCDLAERLREFAASSASVLPIHEFAEVAPSHRTKLFAARTSRPSLKGDEQSFCWLCSPSEVESIHGKLMALATGAPGHQYFYLEGANVQLVVSVGEYDALWARRDG
jgi:hypothetical protein